MQKTTDALLLLTKLDNTDTGKIVREPVNLAALLQEQAREILRVYADKKLELKTALPEELYLNSNSALLQQIVQNLLDNAAKYTPPGGWLKIALAQADGRVIMKIGDNGSGIAAEDLPRIFDRFYRGDKSHAQTIKGSAWDWRWCGRLWRCLAARYPSAVKLVLAQNFRLFSIYE